VSRASVCVNRTFPIQKQIKQNQMFGEQVYLVREIKLICLKKKRIKKVDKYKNKDRIVA